MTETVATTENSESEFEHGLRNGCIRYQSCNACHHAQLPMRFACARCASADLAWTSASGMAGVHALTRVHRAPTEDFADLVPYWLVLARLDEGPLVMAHAKDGLAIGDRIQASFFQHGGVPLLRFVRT